MATKGLCAFKQQVGLGLILTRKIPLGARNSLSALPNGTCFKPCGYTLATLRATGGRSTGTAASSLKRNLNVRTATLKVGHLARGLYATVTTRIHFDWTTSFLSDVSIVGNTLRTCQRKPPGNPIAARVCGSPGFF